MMTESMLVGVLGLLGIGLTAWMTYLAVVYRTLTRRLASAEATNHGLWQYCRMLVDDAYRAGHTPAPPPSYLAHLFKPGDSSI